MALTDRQACCQDNMEDPSADQTDLPAAQAGETIEPAAPDDEPRMTPEQKRSYVRVFARIWLPILLLLIIFVVLLMVVTRHLKLWVLGRHRSVKFKPVDDIWWQNKKDE